MSEFPNIYQKIQESKAKILQKNLKKSGYNKFSKFDYFELSDILPEIINICNELKLFTSVCFSNEQATLKIINSENKDEFVEYSCPIRPITISGCNEIQALGGVITYLRRYLYMTAFDIVENDMFDSISGSAKGKNKEYKCSNCGKNFEDYVDKSGKKWSAGQIYHMSEKKNNGQALCRECSDKVNAVEL